MPEFYLKINGVGNAWPVLLGEDHPFYDRHNFRELANASFSVIRTDKVNTTTFEVLVDGGQGVVQELLATSDRIPEKMVFTHPHFDHTASLDWIARSYFVKHNKEKRFPVYCALSCFEVILRSFPHLEKLLEFHRLIPGKRIDLTGDGELMLTGYPVYHGDSANGAMMMLFETKEGKKALITGDILFPMVREEDIPHLLNVDYLVTDANNRLPYPRSNHWSVASIDTARGTEFERLAEFRKSLDINKVISLHQPAGDDPESQHYFADIRTGLDLYNVPLSVVDFAREIKPRLILPVHYSGGEDEKYYGLEKLNRQKLGKWLNDTARREGLELKMTLPLPGQKYPL